MKITKEQIKSILALPPDQRYMHFIKVVCDWEEVWGLYHDGWAMAATDDGHKVFPVWPAKEYAELCAKDEWEDYEPESFTLDEFRSTLLPTLQKDEVMPGIFYTPQNKGVVLGADQVLADLNMELEKYS
jgi:hypothetical protein